MKTAEQIVGNSGPAACQKLRIQNNIDRRSCQTSKIRNARTFHAAAMFRTANSTAAKRAVMRGAKM